MDHATLRGAAATSQPHARPELRDVTDAAAVIGEFNTSGDALPWLPVEFFVYSRRAVEAVRPHEVPHVIISITSSSEDVARLRANEQCRGILRLSFPTLRVLPGPSRRQSSSPVSRRPRSGTSCSRTESTCGESSFTAMLVSPGPPPSPPLWRVPSETTRPSFTPGGISRTCVCTGSCSRLRLSRRVVAEHCRRAALSPAS